MQCRVVCATGPESAGKTTLCRELAARYGVPWLGEYARERLQGAADYDRGTVAAIAREQWRRERVLIEGTGGPVVLDTDLSVLFVWWREKYGPVPRWIDEAWAAQTPRLYLLCRPDIAWQPDPLRESRHDRQRLFAVYRELLTARGLDFVEVAGTGAGRTAAAMAAAKPVLSRRAAPPDASSPPAP